MTNVESINIMASIAQHQVHDTQERNCSWHVACTYCAMGTLHIMHNLARAGSRRRLLLGVQAVADLKQG